ncbi:hypothetical protein ACWD48_28175 [Streptomyces sp. NPDC002519]
MNPRRSPSTGGVFRAVAAGEFDGSTRLRSGSLAGVVLGSTGHKLGNVPVRFQVHAVYDSVTFLLESVVFAMIGFELPLGRPSSRGRRARLAAVGAGDPLHSAGDPPAVDLPAVSPDPP